MVRRLCDATNPVVPIFFRFGNQLITQRHAAQNEWNAAEHKPVIARLPAPQKFQVLPPCVAREDEPYGQCHIPLLAPRRLRVSDVSCRHFILFLIEPALERRRVSRPGDGHRTQQRALDILSVQPRVLCLSSFSCYVGFEPSRLWFIPRRGRRIWRVIFREGLRVIPVPSRCIAVFAGGLKIVEIIAPAFRPRIDMVGVAGSAVPF